MAKRKKEHFFLKAKEDQYRARSAYKLIQINEDFHILKKGFSVLDIGAAPGSWSQVALEKVGESGKVVSVDILPMPVLKGAEIVLGDITKEPVKEQIKNIAGSFDIILSDAAPEFSGHRELDVGRTLVLNEYVLAIAQDFLKENGTLVMKSFQSNDLNNLIKDLKKNFKVVKMVKPKASQKESSEIYIVCLKFFKD